MALSGRPQLSSSVPSNKPASSKPTASIIEAKPQMRNLSADLTRFVPTTLKVKKDMPQKKELAKPSANPHIEWRAPQVHVRFCFTFVEITFVLNTGINFFLKVAPPSRTPSVPQPPVKTKDDAYSQFMKEMKGFM